MYRAILLQVGAVIFTAVGAWLLIGARGGISAALGGAVCVLPNLLFALRLKLVANRARASFSANFLIGELVKMFATVALLVVVARVYADVHWPSLLIGLALALQAMLFALWKKN